MASRSLLRTSTSGTEDERGRSRERYRRAALTALASYAGKGTGVLVTLVSTPLALGYLGPERYGLWMTIVSVVTIFGFVDLGINNSLLNALSEAHGRRDRPAGQQYVASAFWMMTAIAVLLALLLSLVFPLIPWSSVLAVSSPQAIAEAGPTAAVTIGCFLISLPLGIAQQIRKGYQEGFINGLWGAIASLIGLCFLLIAISRGAGLPWLVLAIAGATPLASLLNTIHLFGAGRSWLRPGWDRIKSHAVKRLWSSGITFLVLQLSVLLTVSTDNIVVAHVLGPEAVASYSVPRTLFTLAPWATTILLDPLWPAYGEALAAGDDRWVRTVLRRSILVVLCLTLPATILLIIFSGQILEWWVGPAVKASPWLLLGLGAWAVLAPVLSALETFLNGANFIRFRAASMLVQGVAGIAVKVLAAQVIGLAGVAWGGVGALLLFGGIPYFLFIRRWSAARHQTS